MAQDGNKILSEILGVCTQINKKLGGSPTGSSKGDAGTGSTFGSFGKKGNMDNAKKGADAINGIVGALSGFAKLKIKPKRIDAVNKSLKGLFATIIWIGTKYKVIAGVVHLFTALVKALGAMTKFVQAVSILLLSIGASILMIAGALALAGVLLGTRGPLMTITVIGLVILGFVGIMKLMAKAGKDARMGTIIAKNMGKALMYMAGGLLAFVISMQLIGSIMKAGNDAKSLLIAAGTIVAIIAGMGLVFAGMGLVGPFIDKGTKVAKGMGMGMAFLALGVLAFAMVAKLITSGTTGGATAYKKDGSERGKFGQMMSEIGPGLGAMGIVLVSAGLFFAGLGVLSAFIVPGILVSLGMAAGLIALSVSLATLIKFTKDVPEGEIKKSVFQLTNELISGLVGGISMGLTGTKASSAAELNLKGVLKLNRGIRMLKKMSRMLSLFAKALTAFATLGNMRVIKGFTEEGEPIFGETVNIEGVGNTVRDTLISFLAGDDGGETGGILGATKTLTRKHAKNIGRMARSLTGRRGILTAVIQFADVLKTYAQFGENNEVGWVEMIPDGTDDDGEIKYKQVYHKTPVAKVVENIAGSFELFVTNLAAKAADFGIDGKEKRKLQNLSKALTGRNGILQPVIDFTRVIDAYSKYGAAGEIVKYKQDANGNIMYDENGEPMELSRTSIEQIAHNVAAVLAKFSTALSTELGTVNSSESKAAGKKMKEFDGMIKQLGKLAENTEGLDSAATSMMKMATAIGQLAEAINTLDVEKAAALAEITNQGGVGAAVGRMQENRAERIEARGERQVAKIEAKKTTPAVTPSGPVKPSPVDIALADAIGERVAAAFKSGQFRFEFATDKSGVLSYE